MANLRRGRAGRRLLAVRTNERAAAAIGVNVFEAKLYAFTLSAAIAGIGGVLLRLRLRSVSFARMFPPGASISVLVLTVIGGAGYVIGPLLARRRHPSGLVTPDAARQPHRRRLAATSTWHSTSRSPPPS